MVGMVVVVEGGVEVEVVVVEVEVDVVVVVELDVVGGGIEVEGVGGVGPVVVVGKVGYVGSSGRRSEPRPPVGGTVVGAGVVVVVQPLGGVSAGLPIPSGGLSRKIYFGPLRKRRLPL